MLGEVSQERLQQARLSSETDGEWGPRNGEVLEGEEQALNGTLTCRTESSDPSKCIMWCAIALGALVQGSPLEYVSCRRRQEAPVGLDFCCFDCVCRAHRMAGGMEVVVAR